MNELTQLIIKVDEVRSTLALLVEAIRRTEKPMTMAAFAKRVGVSRWTIGDRVKRGKIILRNGRVPPSELRKFGL